MDHTIEKIIQCIFCISVLGDGIDLMKYEREGIADGIDLIKYDKEGSGEETNEESSGREGIK